MCACVCACECVCVHVGGPDQTLLALSILEIKVKIPPGSGLSPKCNHSFSGPLSNSSSKFQYNLLGTFHFVLPTDRRTDRQRAGCHTTCWHPVFYVWVMERQGSVFDKAHNTCVGPPAFARAGRHQPPHRWHYVWVHQVWIRPQTKWHVATVSAQMPLGPKCC